MNEEAEIIDSSKMKVLSEFPLENVNDKLETGKLLLEEMKRIENQVID